jgi:predicted component of type VI protein secretion system
MNKHLGRTKTTRATVSPTFHTQTWGEVTKFESTDQARVRQIFSIDYKNGHHTYLSVC